MNMFYWAKPGFRFCLVIALGYCTSIPITVAETIPKPLTLKQAIEFTLDQNPQLHQFQFVQQRLSANRQTSALKPAYKLSFDLENFAGSGETNGLDNAEMTVALSSILELGDKRRSRSELVDAGLFKAELEQQVATLDLLGDLTATFINALTLQEELNLASKEVSLSQSLLKAVKIRAQQGSGSDIEVMRARAMLNQSKIRKNTLLQKLKQQKVSVAKYWAETTVNFSNFDGSLYAFSKPEKFKTLFDKLKASPAIEVFASELRIKKAGIQLAKSQGSGDIEWQVGVRQYEQSGDNALTLGLSIPLFSESRNQGAINAALADQNAVHYQRQDVMLALHEQLFIAYTQRQQYIETYQQLKTQVIPDLEKALKLTREAYNRGRLKYQDWILAQQELLKAQQQLINNASSALINQSVIEQLTAEPLTIKNTLKGKTNEQ